MTKKISLTVLLAIAVTSVNAQMRISGSEAPNQSAVLDLNPDDNVSVGNATLGLALPTGNLGRVVEAEFKQGEKTPILLTLDKQTNELVPFRKDWVKVPEVFKGVQLSEEQKQRLGNGEKVEIKGMTSKQGKPFDAAIQFNADKRCFEFIFDKDKKQSHNQSREMKISEKICGVKLSEEERDTLKAGKSIYLEGMVKDGREFNAYIKVNTEKNKLEFSKHNPDQKPDQKQEKKEPKKGRKVA